MTEWQSIVSTGNIQNSYGSFVRSNRKPPQETTKHFVDASDTLQGISLKYGVTMEDLRRINKLHYTDSIQSRQFLNIPVSKDSNTQKTSDNRVQMEVSEKTVKENSQKLAAKSVKNETRSRENTEESSVHDFLRKLDMQISSTKQTASSMLTDTVYKLPNSDLKSSARYMKKEEFKDSVRTTFSNSNSYHNPSDEHFQL